MILLVVSFTGSAGAQSEVVGIASVIDGDTIEIHGQRIRIFGIDAPETAQLCRGDDSLQYRCGAQAANELDRLIGQSPVTCTLVSLDTYGRSVAECSVGGLDIGEWLVQNGYALDWPKYSNGRYSSAQANASREELGIWAGTFAVPWRYRECVKRGTSISDCSDR